MPEREGRQVLRAMQEQRVQLREPQAMLGLQVQAQEQRVQALEQREQALEPQGQARARLVRKQVGRGLEPLALLQRARAGQAERPLLEAPALAPPRPTQGPPNPQKAAQAAPSALLPARPSVCSASACWPDWEWWRVVGESSRKRDKSMDHLFSER